MDERRKYPRVNVTIFIKLKHESDSALSDCESMDLSEGGICIKSKIEYKQGSIVNLQLFLGNKLADVQGKVVWTKRNEEGEYELGIEYINAEKKNLEEIKKYIENL